MRANEDMNISIFQTLTALSQAVNHPSKFFQNAWMKIVPPDSECLITMCAQIGLTMFRASCTTLVQVPTVLSLGGHPALWRDGPPVAAERIDGEGPHSGLSRKMMVKYGS